MSIRRDVDYTIGNRAPYPTSSDGEINYGINSGATGVGWYIGKDGPRLKFKNIVALDASITIVDDIPNGTIKVGVAAGSNTFTALTDTPATYVGAALQLARVNAGETAIEFVAPTFLADIDTPATYASQALKLARVNAGETAIEFVAPTFLADTDTPSTYASQALKLARVNAGETAIEFVAPTFLADTDTPATYASQALKLARVNAGETAIEFVAPTFLADTDTPATYASQALKLARVNAGETALEFVAPTFLADTDTPATYASQAAKFARVNAGETAIEFGAFLAGTDISLTPAGADFTVAYTGFPELTTAQIEAIAAPALADMAYDTDLNVGKIYNPSNPNKLARRWEQFAVNTEGIVKVNGLYDNAAACTFTSSTDTVNATAHGMADDTRVTFKPGSGALPAELVEDETYWVVNSFINDFQISETQGGAVFPFTDDGTAGTFFYDLDATATKQSIVLAPGDTRFLFYPITSKLQISSATDWPDNDLPLDSVFYNLDVQAGTFTGDTNVGSGVIDNLNTTTNLTEGMLVSGTNVPAGSTILSVDSGTQITIDQNATASGSGISFTFRKNKYLENAIEWQATTFRVRATFTKPSSNIAETVTCILHNPLSGFTLEETNVVRRQQTAGTLTFTVITISDSNSLGEGYTLALTASDTTTIEITDVTRFSAHKSRIGDQ